MASPTAVHAASSEAPAKAAGANGTGAPPAGGSLRDSILATTGPAPVPATFAGFPVWVRGLSGTERSAWDQEQYRRSNGGADQAGAFVNIRGRLLARTIVDEAGERVFSDADADVLGARESGELEPLFDIALTRSGLSEAKAEEIAAGLKVPTSGSGTG